MTFDHWLDTVIAHWGAPGLFVVIVTPFAVVLGAVGLLVTLYRRASARSGVARQHRAFDEAERLIRRLFLIARILQPLRRGPLWAGATIDLALVRQTQGRRDEAALLVRQALAATEGQRHHALRGIGLSVLGELDLVAKRTERAEHYFVLALDAFAKHRGKTLAWHGTAQLNLAQIALRGGRHADAERHAPEAVKLLEKTFGPDHFFVAEANVLQASLALRTGDGSEAERLLRRALAIKEKSFGLSDRRLAGCLRVLALVLMQKDRTAEADQLLARVATIEAKG